MGELTGVLIAIVSSSLGGTAAAVMRHLVGNADPITLAILRWGIGFLVLPPVALLLRVKWLRYAEAGVGLVAVFAGIWIATTQTAKA